MTNKVIGITGRAGVGKDTLAAFFVEQGYVQYSLASPLKAGLNIMFGWTMAQWDDREWKEKVLPTLGKSPRQLAQTLGTEWGRKLVSDDVWLQVAHQFIMSCDKPVVISDVRFNNEADFVQKIGGEVIKVIRHGTGAVSAHESEEGVSPNYVDWTLQNNGSIDSLYCKASRIFPAPKARAIPVLDPNAPSGFGTLTNAQIASLVESWLWATSSDRELLAVRYGLAKQDMDNYVQRYKQAVRNGRPHLA